LNRKKKKKKKKERKKERKYLYIDIHRSNIGVLVLNRKEEGESTTPGTGRSYYTQIT
jgi:hypothetical protein